MIILKRLQVTYHSDQISSSDSKVGHSLPSTQSSSSFRPQIEKEKLTLVCLKQLSMAESENIVLFPFMAQGHLIPFLALALQLEQRTTSCTITIVNTPLNIKKLRSSLPHNTKIRLVELPFCSTDHGLPPDSETTEVLPYSLIFNLMFASQSFEPSFFSLCSNMTRLRCIISDPFLGWTVNVAKKLSVFHSLFITSSAYGQAIFFSVWLNLPHRQSNSKEFLLPDFPEASPIHRSQLSNALTKADGTDCVSIFLQRQLSLCLKTDGILVNTIEELDQKGLQYFRRKISGQVWPIGVVRSYQEITSSSNCCIKWLDTHPVASVLYVSFGSQNTISASQMMELAMGLGASKQNFIWVVRPPTGFDINQEFREEWLPGGFEDRMRKQNKGLLVRKWAPQMEILSLKSVCAFLSHCGWNSATESLIHGVPIIGWPLSAEQFYNVELLSNGWGACAEVARGTNSNIKAVEIARVIGMVMGKTKEGEVMRRKASDVKEMLRNAVRSIDDGHKGSSVKAIDDFINHAFAEWKTN